MQKYGKLKIQTNLKYKQILNTENTKYIKYVINLVALAEVGSLV